jgi:hypothetical protein
MGGMPKILLKKHLGPQTLKITKIIHLGSFIKKKNNFDAKAYLYYFSIPG